MTTPAPWHAHSGVVSCPDCAGTGIVRSWRKPTIEDPYPEAPCGCGRGEHGPECPVCGFTVEVAGYDCLVCHTVASMARAELLACDGENLLRAVGHALLAAQAALLAERGGVATRDTIALIQDCRP